MINTPGTDTPGIETWMLPTLHLAGLLAETDFSPASLNVICESLPGPEGEGNMHLALGVASSVIRTLLGVIDALGEQARDRDHLAAELDRIAGLLTAEQIRAAKFADLAIQAQR